MNRDMAVRGIYKNRGMYFVVQRLDGRWEFPGGKSDNQPLHIALKREIKEETGLSVLSYKPLKTIYNNTTGYYTKFFMVELSNEPIKLQEEEVQSFDFVTKERLKEMNITEDTRLIMRYI